jgi:hypothetical protein
LSCDTVRVAKDWRSVKPPSDPGSTKRSGDFQTRMAMVPD